MFKNKCKKDSFSEKFKCLNTQKSPEINWSSSDSSDLESSKREKFSHCIDKVKSRKRKRKRERTNNSISNLDMAVSCNSNSNKSPVLNMKSSYIKLDTSHKITIENQYKSKSPILTPNNKSNSTVQRSPILYNQKSSPKIYVRHNCNVKKICFKSVDCIAKVENATHVNSKSDNNYVNRIKVEENSEEEKALNVNKTETYVLKDFNIDNLSQFSINNIPPEKEISLNNKDISHREPIKLSNGDPYTKEENALNVNKTETYFLKDLHIENLSQFSINNTPSEKEISLNSNNIEVTSSPSQETTKAEVISQREPTTGSNESIDSDKNFKLRRKFKKESLAHRLDALIKKQDASVSQWHNERFLEANSNFIRPKDKFLSFAIDKPIFRYSCLLFIATELTSEEKYIIIINNIYVNNINLSENSVLKLYSPYNVIETNNYRLILNVSKFECISLEDVMK